MVKLKSSLFGFQARGNLGKSVYFTSHPSGQDARALVPHFDSMTLAQLYRRWQVQDYILLWNTLTPSQKALYHNIAIQRGITDFNAWLSHYLQYQDDIAAYYKFDEASGSLAKDSGPAGNTATIFGATHDPGRIHYSIHGDGLDDYVNFGNPSSLKFGTGDFTISFFFYYFSDSSYGLLSNYYPVDYSGCEIWILPDFLIGISLGGNALSSSLPLISQSWYHLALTRFNGTASLYLNSIFQDSAYCPGNIDKSLPEYWIALAEYDSFFNLLYFFHGSIDDLHFFKRALTQPQIQKLSERRYPL